ncbi:hypothetical protein [Roseivivax halodurans]|nr:hypothetical protein [Roseivivax halodurans]
MAKARSLEESIGEWKVLCANLETTVENQKVTIQGLHDQVDAWNMHYLGLEAERDYLLALLDASSGGADNNPARTLTNEEFRVPNGPRKGERLQKRDVVYLKKVAELAKTRFKQWSNWWALIRDSRIFD